MNVSSTHPAWLAAAGVVLLVGLWLLRRGWRGRRIGREPRCARCGYTLIGLESSRCPECGSDVSSKTAMRIGEIRRSPGAIAVGVLLLLSSGTFLSVTGWRTCRDFDWYTLRPTRFVLNDLEPTERTASPSDRVRAWTEIARRLKAGPLPRSHHDRLADIALARKATVLDTTYSWAEVARLDNIDLQVFAWLDHEAAAGALNERQRARYFEQTQRIKLALQPTDGDERLGFECSRRSVGLSDAFYVKVTDFTVSTDDGPFVRVDGNPGWGEKTWVRVGDVTAQEGRHQLTVKLHIEFFGLEPKRVGETNRALHAYDVTVSALGELRPPPPRPVVRPGPFEIDVGPIR